METIEQTFNEKTYQEYLLGTKTLTEMIKDFHTSEYELKKFFKNNGLMYRREFLNKTTKHDFFNVINCELKAYLLGFYFADGCCYDDYVKISITESDREIVELFKSAISPNRVLHVSTPFFNKKTKYTSKPLVTLEIKSKQICEQLNKFGMGTNKTTETNTDLSMIPIKFMIDFIRGYFDGDGTVCVTKGMKKYVTSKGEIKQTPYHNYNWSIISKTTKHLYIIKDYLLKECGVHSNILEDGRGNFLIEVNRKNDFKKLCELLYDGKSYFLKRKKDKFFSCDIKEDKPKVIKYYKDEVVDVFTNITEAGKDAHITPQGIRVRIKKNLIINGYRWEFA